MRTYLLDMELIGLRDGVQRIERRLRQHHARRRRIEGGRAEARRRGV
ncbi:hypothetical protein ACYF6T_16145 [Streptomyces sp. 7R007]